MRGLGRGEADVDFLGLALGLTSSAHCFGTCQQMKVVNVSNFLPKFYTFSEYMKTLAYVKHNYLLHALIFRMCVVVYILLIHLHSTNVHEYESATYMYSQDVLLHEIKCTK